MKRNYFWNPGYWNVQDKGIGSLALHVERLKAGTWLSSSCILLQWRNRLLSPYSDTNPDTNPAPNLQPSHHQQPYPFHVRDLSFYTWMTSHDLVHSTVILISSLHDSSFPSLLLVYVSMRTSLKSFREQDKNLHDFSDETPMSSTTFLLPNTRAHILILSM